MHLITKFFSENKNRFGEGGWGGKVVNKSDLHEEFIVIVLDCQWF